METLTANEVSALILATTALLTPVAVYMGIGFAVLIERTSSWFTRRGARA